MSNEADNHDKEVPAGPSSWSEVSSVIGDVDPAPEQADSARARTREPEPMKPAEAALLPSAGAVDDATVAVDVTREIENAPSLDVPPVSKSASPPEATPRVAGLGAIAPLPPLTPPPSSGAPPAALSSVRAETPPSPPSGENPLVRADGGTAIAGPSSDVFRWQPGEIKLVIEQGMSIGKEFLLSDADMLVGRRDPDQDFIPDIDLFDQEAANNRYISRRQARLYFRESRLYLEDLESSNGTALNNKLVAAHEPRVVNLNDKLLFGQSVLLRVKRV